MRNTPYVRGGTHYEYKVDHATSVRPSLRPRHDSCVSNQSTENKRLKKVSNKIAYCTTINQFQIFRIQNSILTTEYHGSCSQLLTVGFPTRWVTMVRHIQMVRGAHAKRHDMSTKVLCDVVNCFACHTQATRRKKPAEPGGSNC